MLLTLVGKTAGGCTERIDQDYSAVSTYDGVTQHYTNSLETAVNFTALTVSNKRNT